MGDYFSTMANDIGGQDVLKLDEHALLTRLFNNCIRSGQWPSCRKIGVWTPVFKKDDRANKINYRPITVLNSVAKAFESLLCQ